jgi:hypothetical protein
LEIICRMAPSHSASPAAAPWHGAAGKAADQQGGEPTPLTIAA